MVRSIAIVGVVLGRHVLADFEVCGKLSHLATMRRRLGIFAFCGLIPAWFLSQTKRYRPEAAAAAADRKFQFRSINVPTWATTESESASSR